MLYERVRTKPCEAKDAGRIAVVARARHHSRWGPVMWVRYIGSLQPVVFGEESFARCFRARPDLVAGIQALGGWWRP
jgi:hypothetical protein